MSTKMSTDLNIERSSTRLHAPPGGKSSISFGDSDPSPPSVFRAQRNIAPKSSINFSDDSVKVNPKLASPVKAINNASAGSVSKVPTSLSSLLNNEQTSIDVPKIIKKGNNQSSIVFSDNIEEKVVGTNYVRNPAPKSSISFGDYSEAPIVAKINEQSNLSAGSTPKVQHQSLSNLINQSELTPEEKELILKKRAQAQATQAVPTSSNSMSNIMTHQQNDQPTPRGRFRQAPGGTSSLQLN